MTLLLGALLIGLAADPPPEFIYHHARVFTAEPARPRAEAFSVSGGRILAVGTSTEILKSAGPGTRVVDLGGAFVSPGFGDSHLHFMNGSLNLNVVNLGGAATLAEIQKRVSGFAAEHPQAAWITGRGWNYAAFPGGLPQAAWLDAVVPDRPAFMSSYDGHTGWANTRALALAGITRETPDPPNGAIVKNPDGQPTGALKEAAQRLVRDLVPKPSDEEKYRALKAGLDLAASYGLTFATNAGFDLADLPAYERVIAEGGLKLRFLNATYFEADPTPETLKELDGLRAKYPSPRFRFGAVKALLDGVVESKTAWMLEPYEGGGGSGQPNYTAETFDRSIAAYDRAGVQLFVHAIGDRAVQSTLDAFERAARLNGTSGRRHRVEHIEVSRPEDLARFKPLGVIASTQALFATPDDDDSTPCVYFGNLGPERSARTMAFKAIDDAGAVQAFGSDWPVYSLDVLKGIYTAVTRQTVRGTPPGGLNPQSRIGVDRALRHFTADGAYASFAEDEHGRIAPGLSADFVVLSKDITAVPPREILDTRVLLTVMEGHETFRAEGFTAGRASAGQ